MAYPDEMLQILKNEYGIHNMTGFDEAFRKLSRLDISIFVKPLTERSNKHGRKNELRSDQKGKRKLSAEAAGI